MVCACALCRQTDSAARRRVLDRVGQNIYHNLLDAFPVADHRRQVRLGLNEDHVTAVLGGQLHGIRHLFQQIGHREPRHTQLHPSVIQLGKRQQIGDNTRHALALARNNAQKLLFRVKRQLSGGIEQRFGVRADIRQRRAQLVRHVCHKLAACVIQTALLGDIVNDGDDAALAVQCAVRRQRDGQHAPKSRNLVRKEAARDGFVRIRHVQIGEHLIKAQLLLYTHAQQIFGCRIHVDERAVGREGGYAVGHVQEQRVQLVALALHLANRVFQTVRHVIERTGQLADLIRRLHTEVLIKVAFRDRPRTLGDALNRRGDGLAEQEGQQDSRQQAEHHRLHDNLEEPPRQVGNLPLVVRDIHDVVHRTVAVFVERHRNVHNAVGYRRARSGLSCHCGNDVARAGDGYVRVGAIKEAALTVENGIVAVIVNAESALVGIYDGFQTIRAGFGSRLLHGADGVGREHRLHLLIKAVQIEGVDTVDQKRADHRHNGYDQQHQNQHQFSV